jgi:signal transduction histidine kinase
MYPMKNTTQIMFILSFSSSLVMAALSYAAGRAKILKSRLRIFEFWAAVSLHGLAYYFLYPNPALRALSQLFWIWPLRSLILIQAEIAGVKLKQKWSSVLLLSGIVVSSGLYKAGLSFFSYSLPFVLALCLNGLGSSWVIHKNQKTEDNSILEKSAFLFSGLLCLNFLGFPFWAAKTETIIYGVVVELLILIGLWAGQLLALTEQVTEKKIQDLEKKDNQRSERLISNSKYSEIGMMAAGIAHEINNPLAVIQARVSQLLRIYQMPEKKDELYDGLKQIHFTSERINKTIQGIRELIRDDKSGLAKIELKSLVDDVLSFCGQRMKNHGVNLRFYGLEQTFVWGNKVQLEQILLNLLNNSFDAIEYLPEKWIEISASVKNDQVQIAVKDSGTGIPAETASHIMEPFFTTKDVGKGTGLGLAMARGIAEKHGGSLNYIQGASHTTFVLELPVYPQAEWGMPMVH